jgi:Protein of unknown function (DUF2905)
MSLAKALVLTGAALMVAGLAVWLVRPSGGTGGAFSWIGRLPGDIQVERPNFRFYFPLTTCVVASLALTALLWLFRRGGH